MSQRVTGVGEATGPKSPATVSSEPAPQPLGGESPGRVRYFLRRRCLDQELANGREPCTGPMLHRRAAELSSMAHRERLANGYRRLLQRADAPPRVRLVPVNWQGVRSCRDRIRRLAERLTDDTTARVRGIALAELLLTDGSGPLYRCGEEAELDSALRQTLSAL